MHKTQSISSSPNLNNLPFLAAILEHGSITRAGLELGLSQSAASRVMAQLRKQLGDPLLVRTQQGYQLTDYARGLEHQVIETLSLTESLFRPKEFSPASDKRLLKITTTDFGALMVVDALNAKLQNEAPNVSVDCYGWADDTLTQLEQGRVDMALFDESEIPPDCHREYLFTESYHLVYRAGHPLGNVNSKKEVLRLAHKFPRIVLSFPTGRHFAKDDVLERCGFEDPPSRMAVPYFHSALWMLPSSDSVMAVPSSIFQRFRNELKLTGWPLDQWGEEFDYYLIWHHRSKDEPFHIWMRNQIKALKLV